MAFSEKLKMIMERKKMSCRDVAIAMCNYGSDTDLWDAKGNKEKRSGIRKIEKWRSGTAPRNVSDIETLCKVLDCDFSYFFDDEPIENLNNQKIADYLGLNIDVVSRIKNYNKSEKELLFKLVSSQKQDNLLKLLQAIYTYSLEAHHANVQLDVIGTDLWEKNEINQRLIRYSCTPGNTLLDISKKMLKYSVVSALDEVLSDTYNDYTNEGNLLLKQRLLKLSEMKKKEASSLLEKRKTLKERGEELSIDELNLLLDNKWNDKLFPTEQDIHKRIDEKYRRLYDFYKE